NYLIHWDIGTFAELKQGVDRAVNLYNREKPHISLKRLSPLNFEKLYISTGKTSDGEKSTTEYETQTRRADISPAGLGKHPQDQISLKNEKNECLIVYINGQRKSGINNLPPPTYHLPTCQCLKNVDRF